MEALLDGSSESEDDIPKPRPIPANPNQKKYVLDLKVTRLFSFTFCLSGIYILKNTMAAGENKKWRFGGGGGGMERNKEENCFKNGVLRVITQKMVAGGGHTLIPLTET